MKKLFVQIDSDIEKQVFLELINEKTIEVVGQLLSYEYDELQLGILKPDRVHLENKLIQKSILHFSLETEPFLDIRLLNTVEKYAPLFYDMCSRIDNKKNQRFEDRKRLWQHLIMHWDNTRKSNWFDAIYTCNTPHEPVSFALYAFAKASGIETYFLQDNSILGTRLLLSDIDSKWHSIQPEKYTKSSLETAKEKRIIESIIKVSQTKEIETPIWEIEHKKKMKLAIKNQNNKMKSYLGRLLTLQKIFVREISILKSTQKLNCEDSKVLFILDLIINITSQYKAMIDFEVARHEYLEMSSNNLESINENSIVFFLSYNPENSVNPLGKEYYEQFLAICQIKKTMPQSMNLFVKEHPAQFNKYAAGYNYVGRETGFYRKIRAIGIEIIPESSTSQEVLSTCGIVATISGTVGWEAVLMSKPVLFFGTTWYEEAPKVIKVDSKTDLKTILSNITSLSTSTNKSKILDFVKNCFDTSLHLPISGIRSTTNNPKFISEMHSRFKDLIITISR